MSDQQLITELNALNVKTVKEFSFDGFNCLAKVIRVHDPDTITIVFKYQNTFYKKNLRLNGIDAPELHSKIKSEADLCKAGQVYLSGLILNKIIKVHMGAFDKYGRILSNIYLYPDNTDIIQNLITGGFVREYDGGHKDTWNIGDPAV